MLHLIRFIIGTRQCFIGFFSLKDLCLLKAKIRCHAPVFIDHLQKRLSDIALAIGGHFQSHVL